MATRNLRNGSITIKDGSGTPKTLVIPIEEGDLHFVVKDNAPLIRNRGALSGYGTPMEEPVEIDFSALFEEWTGKSTTGASPSPADVMRQKGLASAWVSTSTCGPYTVTLVFTIANPCQSGDQAETLTFTKVRIDEIDFKEAPEANKLSFKGRALMTTPTAARS